MSRNEILTLIKEVINAYKKDPKKAMVVFCDPKNLFSLLDKSSFIDTDEPLFDLILYTEDLLSGADFLHDVEELYKYAVANVPKPQS